MQRIAMLQQESQPPGEMALAEGMGMKITAPTFEADVDPEDPNAVTLKQVHDWLQERLQNGLTIDVNDASVNLTYCFR